MIQEATSQQPVEDQYNPGIAGLLPQLAKPGATLPQNQQLEQYNQYLNMMPMLKSLSVLQKSPSNGLSSLVNPPIPNTNPFIPGGPPQAGGSYGYES